LEDRNFYISLFFPAFCEFWIRRCEFLHFPSLRFCIGRGEFLHFPVFFLDFFKLEDGNFYISLIFLRFFHWKGGIFILPCFFLAFCEFWIRRWEFLRFPDFSVFLHWKMEIVISSLVFSGFF